MTKRKFTPPTEFPTEYLTYEGRKATIVAYNKDLHRPYIGTFEGSNSWAQWDEYGTHHVNDCYNIQDLPQHKLNVPWEYIKDEYKWVAMDKSGEVWVFEKEPNRLPYDGIWHSTGEEVELDRNGAMKLNCDKVSWEHSLTKRPEES